MLLNKTDDWMEYWDNVNIELYALIKQVKNKVEETAYYANIKLNEDLISTVREDTQEDIEEGFVHSSEGC